MQRKHDRLISIVEAMDRPRLRVVFTVVTTPA